MGVFRALMTPGSGTSPPFPLVVTEPFLARVRARVRRLDRFVHSHPVHCAGD